MTPADYMRELALPDALDFKADPRSRRRAYHACVMAFHLKDHLKRAGVSGIETTIRGATGHMFDVVRGVCNGTKHVQTDGSHLVAFTAGADTDRPPGILGEMILDTSILEDTEGGRDVITPDGPVDLYDALSTLLQAYATVYPQHFIGCDLSSL